MAIAPVISSLQYLALGATPYLTGQYLARSFADAIQSYSDALARVLGTPIDRFEMAERQLIESNPEYACLHQLMQQSGFFSNSQCENIDLLNSQNLLTQPLQNAMNHFESIFGTSQKMIDIINDAGNIKIKYHIEIKGICLSIELSRAATGEILLQGKVIVQNKNTAKLLRNGLTEIKRSPWGEMLIEYLEILESELNLFQWSTFSLKLQETDLEILANETMHFRKIYEENSLREHVGNKYDIALAYTLDLMERWKSRPELEKFITVLFDTMSNEVFDGLINALKQAPDLNPLIDVLEIVFKKQEYVINDVIKTLITDLIEQTNDSKILKRLIKLNDLQSKQNIETSKNKGYLQGLFGFITGTAIGAKIHQVYQGYVTRKQQPRSIVPRCIHIIE